MGKKKKRPIDILIIYICHHKTAKMNNYIKVCLLTIFITHVLSAPRIHKRSSEQLELPLNKQHKRSLNPQLQLHKRGMNEQLELPLKKLHKRSLNEQLELPLNKQHKRSLNEQLELPLNKQHKRS